MSLSGVLLTGFFFSLDCLWSGFVSPFQGFFDGIQQIRLTVLKVEVKSQ